MTMKALVHSWSAAAKPVVRVIALLLPTLIALFGVAGLHAQEEFTPPVAFPVDRYQAGWAKNPFTLPSAPPTQDKVSAAKDLAIGGFYGLRDNATIAVVNVKTQERFNLKKGETLNGITLDDYSIQPTRKETTAEVSVNGEKATLHFDNSYIRQQSGASEAAKTPDGTPPNVNPGGQMPPSMTPRTGPGAPPTGVPGTTRPLPTPPGSHAPGVTFPNAPTIPTPVGRQRLTAPQPRAKTN